MRMIGDVDDSANALWSLREKDAKSHDEARIQSLKDGMDGVLIFVCFPPYSDPRHGHRRLMHESPGWFILCFFTSFVIDKI
jgi:hypothetical protein